MLEYELESWTTQSTHAVPILMMALGYVARRWYAISVAASQMAITGPSLYPEMLHGWLRKLEQASHLVCVMLVSKNASSISIFARLHELGKLLYAAPTLQNLKKRLGMLLHGCRDRERLRDWYALQAGDGALARAIAVQPEMNGILFWPYIHKDWPRARRLEVVARHYEFLQRQPCVLADAIRRPVELLALDAPVPGLRLVLDRPRWFMREGELVLNIFHEDRRLYSAAFTLGGEGEEKVAYVGALQGSNVPEAMQMYREMTHQLHGLRPRDLLMASLKLLCAAIGVRELWAIRGEFRQHNSDYFGRNKRAQVLADYDEVWGEHEGRDLGNGFMAISTQLKERDMANIPSKKRAAYRRRYALLGELKERIGAACALRRPGDGARQSVPHG